MKIAMVGCGRLGIAIANALMLLDSGNAISFYEPLPANQHQVRDGEFLEMVMVAKATGNKALWNPRSPGTADVYVITAGKPRTSPKETKESLFAENYGIVAKLVEKCRGEVYIATNPPIELAQRFQALPLRDCTDNLRKECWGRGWKRHNDIMLSTKGYTSYGPAVAMAKEVLGR